MNAIKRANHHLYKANLDLSEIRANISAEIERISDYIFTLEDKGCEPEEMTQAYDVKNELVNFYESLG